MTNGRTFPSISWTIARIAIDEKWLWPPNSEIYKDELTGFCGTLGTKVIRTVRRKTDSIISTGHESVCVGQKVEITINLWNEMNNYYLNEEE